MLQAPIEGYEDAIVVPPINANNFELKQTLINLVQSNQFTRRQDPHNHLRFFNKVTSTFRHPEDALDSAAGGNFLDKIPRECLSIIESKSKVRYSRSRVTDIAAALEDKLDIRMNRFEKSLNEMKNSLVTPTAPLKAVTEAPIEGYEDAIVIPPINANNFELKQTLINLVQSNQFTRRQDPHNHLSTFRHPEVPNTTVKLLLFPFSLEGEERIWLDKEPSRSILTWEDLVSKFINHFFPRPRQCICVTKS
nr:reverse transcriptase domain-containing protein [Tanacetum cinerariifolium]